MNPTYEALEERKVMDILDDGVFRKYLDEYRSVLRSFQDAYVGKTVQIKDYNSGINGRKGRISEVRLVDGDVYFHLDGGSLSFEPKHLRLIQE